jgi:acetyl esterase/lipase
MRKVFLPFFLISATLGLSAQEQVIPLYQGRAPGSENWNWHEKETGNTPMKMRILYNVTNPTLTVFRPDPAVANGTAVIICPGGGYYVLNIDHEGINVAKELNKKGITAFVFKYRLVQSLTDDPWKEMMNTFKDTAIRRAKTPPIIKMAQEDLIVAMKYVRSHAPEFNIDTGRIGVIGFSAGGGLSRGMAHNYTPDTRPAFAGVMYLGISPNLKVEVPPDAPPLFIAAATDDILLPAMHNIELYKLWIVAKRSAELHMYATGGHGLREAPSNTWIYRFEEWLGMLGLLKTR